MQRRKQKLASVAAVGTAAALMLTACGGAGGSSSSSGGGKKTVNVLMVNNPQMKDLQKLTKANFTKKTGIKVHYTVLPEDDVRNKISQEFSSQAGQYDVATVSNYEVPTYARNHWLKSLDHNVAADSKFDQSDILKPMAESLTGKDGHIYAEPFYGESSFLMYRKDVFKKLGLTMPKKPTWPQVAKLAAKADGAKKGMSGICLRGEVGWGELFAPLTTVVNTYGGTWFTKDWHAKVNGPGFEKATKFYVNLVRKHGEPGASQDGFTECLNNMTQGKSAMWYDATSAAGSLEAMKAPSSGKIGYVQAPTVKTKHSGWLYSWAFAIEKKAPHTKAAEKFIEWASSKQYEQLVGKKLGWSRVPAGKRKSTYQNPHYQKAAAPFYKQTESAIKNADPKNPGVQPRPVPGIQFVAIPEFADLGTKVSHQVSAAIAGKKSVSAALQKGQAEAAKVAKKYRKKH
jgi:sorbitol/mannitol transport system substrate-binding protein